ncbi:MAG TPA: AAA family ATPase, partial [Chthoniobacterales bacterium]|nr:AAA family ATPase [Chthoniobacterales bacterium]
MAFTRKTAIGFLRRAHDQKRLAHAYLISGPIGSGKREVAAELANAVNGTSAADVFSSKAREIFVAEPESKSRRILIEQIRELEHGLQMRGSEGRRKVAIIAEADRLQPQAANAFLKTLEEPPANSLLLLLSALPEALPDTIVSRCISIPLSANGEEIEMPERSELVELLRRTAHEKDWGVQQAYKVAQGVQSLLGAIKEQITNQTADAFKEEETRYRNSTDGVWLEDRED